MREAPRVTESAFHPERSEGSPAIERQRSFAALRMTLFLLTMLWLAPTARAAERIATDDESLRESLRAARPGDVVRIRPGTYRGGVSAPLVGEKDRPIVIEGDEKVLPVIDGGGSGIHLPGAAYVTLRNLHLRGATGNGLNIDDGGDMDGSAVGIVIENVRVSDVGPRGNTDGIKLSGVRDFAIRNCTVEGWGGSAIDMVGCADGVIEGCTFRGKDGFEQATGPQLKGGTRDVIIRECRFDRAGGRAINVGGSTGPQYFRPLDANYEAKDITIERNVFRGGQAAVAFVGVDGATFRDNVVHEPDKWVLRILQESRDARFVPCRNGIFERNVIVYRRSAVRTACNIGPGTRPESFTFTGNTWWCPDAPQQSKPDLPAEEKQGTYGVDPAVKLDDHGLPTTRPK